MADLEANMVDLLEGSTGITNLVGTRIYPLLVPQGTQYPALTYQVVSEERTPELTKQNGLMRARVQITCWATTYAGAKALKEAVRNAIDGESATFPNGVFIENGIDTVEESEGSRPGRLFGKRVDALVWVTEEDPTFA